MQHTQAVGTGGAETDLDRVAWIEKRPLLGPSIGKGPGPGTQKTIGGDTVKHGPFFYKVYPRTRPPIPLKSGKVYSSKAGALIAAEIDRHMFFEDNRQA